MKLKLLSAATTALLGASALFAASPAATQKWVQDYVATHGCGGGGRKLKLIATFNHFHTLTDALM